ncbi:MAG: DMT family transporter, partial [Burkholderiales bacterium]|nr:DMT family transporter [Burkholderiales bacterium]
THDNRRGIVAMTAAMACFVVNDALVKYASESLPAGQLIFIRSALATALLGAIAVGTGQIRHIRSVAQRWVATRSLLDVATTFLYLFSLFQLPISTAVAINSTSPLMITPLAAWLAGGRMRASLWLVTAVGFLGVLLIVQPRAHGFNVYALLCLGSAVMLALRDVLTRRVHAGVPSIVVTLSATLTVTAIAGLLSLVEGWAPLDASLLTALAGAALAVALAYVLTVRSTRHGDLAIIVPFRYSALLFAAVAGYLVWGDLPNGVAWLGIALVVGSGIHVLRADRRARNPAPATDRVPRDDLPEARSHRRAPRVR